jgi:hypothetical protein
MTAETIAGSHEPPVIPVVSSDDVTPSTAHPGTARPSITRTVVAGLGGGLGFGLGSFLTFAHLSGWRRGDTVLLFDPDTQHPTAIAVGNEIEPLPWVIGRPPVILGGMVPLVVAFAFVYRSVTPAWSPRITPRALRLFFIVWIAGVFAEFTRPFNVLHQPLYLSVVGLLFGTAPALLTSFAIAADLEHQRGTSPIARPAGTDNQWRPAQGHHKSLEPKRSLMALGDRQRFMNTGGGRAAWPVP